MTSDLNHYVKKYWLSTYFTQSALLGISHTEIQTHTLGIAWISNIYSVYYPTQGMYKTHNTKGWNTRQCVTSYVIECSDKVCNEFCISCNAVYVVVQSLSYIQLCNPKDCSTPGFPVHHCLPEFAQTHVHWVDNAMQPSHPLSPPSPALNLSQLQGLFQEVGSSHQVVKVLELQFQHQFFQWIFRTDFL